MGNPLRRLAEEWKTEAERLRERYSDGRLAALCEAYAQELMLMMDEWVTKQVSLTEAKNICGYSVAALSRQVSRGKLRNYGREKAPKVRICELPMKPGYMSPMGMISTLMAPPRLDHDPNTEWLVD